MFRFAAAPARAAFRPVAKRSFQTSRVVRGAHFEEGVYSNLPFKVHNRKIPFAIVFFGFFGLGFSLPLVAVWWQLKKSGAFKN
ncbi:hypothetical protein BABINDRAFT_37989 [Babjeviella inositovora NRRL Y-12698]|uniref:Cytochrome c oxidase subunit 8, mitochondrial n=1 Tax=Babjeviella inositovora NRRL Y-12698 TaxID=984486 RepID=A0A1E3QND5_9ASCO|nr:uncharacterized protein BABINDRAFT_37989 [Babjeviella inositovora NRRL Y-12698]ODQ78954.1 hypothetical protein BABINDRAFT_37989 [Babjeviella inositovora NRRL Y-12698]